MIALVTSSASHAPNAVAGVFIPDSKLAVKWPNWSWIPSHRSCFITRAASITGVPSPASAVASACDPELLYADAMFHDMGLTPQYASSDKRFEVASANAARNFLRSHGIAERDLETVWTAIALHTTPGVPPHMLPSSFRPENFCGVIRASVWSG